jgi:hypothetical protein
MEHIAVLVNCYFRYLGSRPGGALAGRSRSPALEQEPKLLPSGCAESIFEYILSFGPSLARTSRPAAPAAARARCSQT